MEWLPQGKAVIVYKHPRLGCIVYKHPKLGCIVYKHPKLDCIVYITVPANLILQWYSMNLVSKVSEQIGVI